MPIRSELMNGKQGKVYRDASVRRGAKDILGILWYN
jgi:hypothetical protein